MIKLYDRSSFFKLEVLDYEFKRNEASYEIGLEWLEIEIHANYELLNWKAKGPFLTISELFRLKNWLEDISNFNDG